METNVESPAATRHTSSDVETRKSKRRQFEYATKGNARLHRIVVERALGHPIPIGAEVHHVNGDGFDAGRGNLVLCQDVAYHKLLHLRQRALDACGHADWRMCTYCREYDRPENLGFAGRRKCGQPYHRACAARYQETRRDAALNELYKPAVS